MNERVFASPARCRSVAALLLGGVSLAGCAVTTPEPWDVREVRAAVAEDPGVPIEQLSRELGISDAAVIAALPEEMRREVDQSALRGLFIEMPEWGKVQFRCQDGDHLIHFEAEGIGMGLPMPEHINVYHEDGFCMYLRLSDIGSAWLLDRPDEQGFSGRGLVLCDKDGQIKFWFMLLIEKSPAFSRAWEQVEG